MHITLGRSVAVAAVVLAAACSSVEPSDSGVQLPGGPSKRTGLEVPPDAWAHPPVQAASAVSQP